MQCQDVVRPFLGLHNGTMSPGGVYQVAPAQRTQTHIFKWLNLPAPFCLSQAPINFTNSEFYGFSELFYCTEDVLRLGGPYDSHKYSRAAAVNGHASLRHSEQSWSVRWKLTGSPCFVSPCRTTAPPSGRRSSSVWTTNSSLSTPTSTESGQLPSVSRRPTHTHTPPPKLSCYSAVFIPFVKKSPTKKSQSN